MMCGLWFEAIEIVRLNPVNDHDPELSHHGGLCPKGLQREVCVILGLGGIQHSDNFSD